MVKTDKCVWMNLDNLSSRPCCETDKNIYLSRASCQCIQNIRVLHVAIFKMPRVPRNSGMINHGALEGTL